MPACHFPHCGRSAVAEHPQHKIHLCERCRALVDRFGVPTTLGDLTKLIALAVLKFGPGTVRSALSRLEKPD